VSQFADVVSKRNAFETLPQNVSRIIVGLAHENRAVTGSLQAQLEPSDSSE
jgi:hypothetical protein